MQKRTITFSASDKKVDIPAMIKKIEGMQKEELTVFQRWINSAKIYRLDVGDSIEITLPRWKEIVSVDGSADIYEHQIRDFLFFWKYYKKVRVGFLDYIFDFRGVFNHRGKERNFIIKNTSKTKRLVFMVKER